MNYTLTWAGDGRTPLQVLCPLALRGLGGAAGHAARDPALRDRPGEAARLPETLRARGTPRCTPPPSRAGAFPQAGTALEEAKAELAAASRSLEAGAPDAEAGLRAARLRDLVEKMEIAAVALD